MKESGQSNIGTFCYQIGSSGASPLSQDSANCGHSAFGQSMSLSLSIFKEPNPAGPKSISQHWSKLELIGQSVLNTFRKHLHGAACTVVWGLDTSGYPIRQSFHFIYYLKNKLRAIRLFMVSPYLPLSICERKCFSRGLADIL
jgi:hypothetical protein